MKSKKTVLAHSEDDDPQEFEIEAAQILLGLFQGAGKFIDDPAGMRQYLANWKAKVEVAVECTHEGLEDWDNANDLFCEIIDPGGSAPFIED
jgi:hypothetical protein